MSMKYWIKILCSSLLGISNGYCMPILLMVALNISKGNGVNKDGEMFQIPAVVLIIICLFFCVFVMYMLMRSVDNIKKILLCTTFALPFVFFVIKGINLFA